ncbi:PREDICTED: uncharacterized protein LOC104805691 [Tarenaya hassleriana]|uniref:uncharacterized protein LOC104805691 n=1 Tax=Tarenaya hassleriana TaxID=28532 RepID=UPI00053C4DAC|nr:PREDICTED: uncharacterized protein LOC104805691 [Tarenaya hassleriana]
MGKPSRSKRSENFEKGKVTPMQVAFLVDRYLCDNRFSETRSVFRSEAASLMSKSPACEVRESLMTLDDIINEYICLKEQKVMADQERSRLEQEKARVQNLLQGMQDVMNAYNASVAAAPPGIPAAAPTPEIPLVSQTTVMTPQQNNFHSSPSGCTVYKTANIMPVSLPGNKRVECRNFSTPSTSQSMTRKRKGPEFSSGAPPISRKTRNKTEIHNPATDGLGMDKFPQPDKVISCSASETPSDVQTLAKSCSATEISGHGSNVAKCLFNKAVVSPSTTSTCPNTPQMQASPKSDKSITPQDLTPTNCTIVSKERITVSPLKQIASYAVERSQVISSSPAKSNKRGLVKGRLNFDGSVPPTTAVDRVSTPSSGSEQETDLSEMDFPTLDLLGETFSFSELLSDFDLGYVGAMETVSGDRSSSEPGGRKL